MSRKPAVQKPKSGTTEQIEWRPLEELRPYERNSRTHTAEQVAEVARSITEFGWVTPALVTAEGMIVAGHARIEAARLLGLPAAKVLVVDGMSPQQVRAYVIADNKLALNAGWDPELLRMELRDLDESGFEVDVLGFSDDDVARLLDDADAARLRGMGTGAGAAGGAGSRQPTGSEDHDTFTAPVTPLQMGFLRDAVKRAKTEFGVKTTGDALVAIVQAWLAKTEAK